MNIIIFSEGPPPLGSTIAEGGALRAWGIAKGLVAGGHRVTLAYRSTYAVSDDADTTNVPSGLAITTWDEDKVNKLLVSHQVVVMRYAMGESWEIVKRLDKKHILVADSYVPISIEVSARDSNDVDEATNYLRLQKSSAKAMLRADYILYASHSQLLYYLGYLSGLNKLNPTTYKQLSQRMFELPYGVDPSDKPSKTPYPPKDLTILWYGAFYSWFDVEALIPSLVKLRKTIPGFKLLVAGAKNPYNRDSGLLAYYEKTVEKLAVLGDAVEYIPWTSYNKRFDIYERATAILTYNHLGLENEVAWRTRLMDFVLADRPILTNGGDPLGEELIKRKIAYRIVDNDLVSIVEKIKVASSDDGAFAKAKADFAWDGLTQNLSEALRNPTRLDNGLTELKERTFFLLARKLYRLTKKPFSAVRYLKEQGMVATMQLAKKRITRK